MATLTVGTGKQYVSIRTALEAARDGDVVAVSTGIYMDDVATIRTKVTLIAVGGKVALLASAPLASGKALLTVTTDAVIDGFVFAGAKAADGTAAGLLDTGGALTVRNSLFTGNQNGLLVQASTGGTVLIQASEFAGNGAGTAFPATSAWAPLRLSRSRTASSTTPWAVTRSRAWPRPRRSPAPVSWTARPPPQ